MTNVMPVIRVICNDDYGLPPAHHSRDKGVITFFRKDDGSWDSAAPWRLKRGDLDGIDPGHKLLTSRDGQMRGYHAKHTEDASPYVVFRLRCRVCNFGTPTPVRESTLRPVLDQLVEARVETISLRGLVARVRS